jgi:dipeptidyl aminopeptidase/acylaminoacyl peptidase
MNAKFIFPPNFRKTSKKKYPVLIEIYGGPGSQKVSKQYEVDKMHDFSLLGMIILHVDGRGTGFKGRKFRSSTYKHLGKYETHDYITAAKYLHSNIDG